MTERLIGLSSMATRALLADLAAAYERRSGTKVAIDSVGGVDAARRIRAGERFDAVVLASGAMALLEAEGHLLPGSRVDVALSPMAMAVPAGSIRPSLADGDAVRRAVLDAGRVGISTGPSGEQLKRLLREWGLADGLSGRLVQAPPGVPVGTLLARREVNVAFQQWSELADLDGVEIVGRLPPELGTDTVFTAGLAASSLRAEATRHFLVFLASDATDDAKRRQGMDPVRPTFDRFRAATLTR